MLSSKALKSVCSEVYRRVPQVEGCKPTVKRLLENNKTEPSSDERYLLVFSNKERNKKDNPITTYVRVVADNQGKILKLSTSR